MKLIKVYSTVHGDYSGRTETYIDDDTGNLYTKTIEYTYDDKNPTIEHELTLREKLKYSQLWKDKEEAIDSTRGLQRCVGNDSCEACNILRERLNVLHQRYNAARAFTTLYDPPKPIGKIKAYREMVEKGHITKGEFKEFTGEDYEI